MKVIKFAPGLIPVFKHQEHDQSTHGSWADSFDRPEGYDDLDVPDGELPEIVYHVTSSKNDERISQTGLQVSPEDTWNIGASQSEKFEDGWIWGKGENGEWQKEQYRPNGVYVFRSLESAKEYAQTGSSIYAIDTKRTMSSGADVIRDPSWSENWDYMDDPEREQAWVLNKVPKDAVSLIVQKHQEHDQSSHGSWAGGSVSFKQDKNSLTMQDESGKTLASVDFVNLGNNRLDVNSIDSFDEGKGYATKVLEKLYSLFPEHSIFWGKTIVPASTHLAQKFSDQYGRTEFIPWGEGVIDGYEWGQVYGDTAVKKHEQHDQSTHGSWATGQTGDASTRELLLQQASQYETFEEFSNAVSLQGLRPRAWHIADTGFELDPDFKPMSRTGGTSDEPGLFVGDPETWQDYAVGRSTVIEYDVSNLSFTAKPLADTSADFFPDQSGNQGFFIRPSAFSRLREVRRMPIEEALSRAKQQQDAMPKSKAEAKQIWEESRSIQKHAMHDQKTHGSWATGGNGLGIEAVQALHKSSDPLKERVYEAERSIAKTSVNTLEKPTAPKLSDFPSRGDYDKAYKEYSKKWMKWAVEERASVLSELGEKLLDGTPSGIKKYVNEVIKQDWFIETFGDGKSLPPLDVTTANTVAGGRHILGLTRYRETGRVIAVRHEISIDRQNAKNEEVILHEISHYATVISQTESFSQHGTEFARNHVFISDKVAGSTRAQELENAYKEKGVKNEG